MIIYHSKLDDIQKINFLCYQGTSNKNILFIGSCRNTPIMHYLNKTRPDLNLYCIYLPYWDVKWSEKDKTKLRPGKWSVDIPVDEIRKILKNTIAIVTESATNYGILSTKREQSDNFFETFEIKDSLPEIRMSNLRLEMYFFDIVCRFKKQIEDVPKIFQNSRERLKMSLVKYGYEKVDRFIEDNLTNIKLFATINHPTRVLSLLMFKCMMDKLGVDEKSFNLNFVESNIGYNFLEHNSSPITDLDIDFYKFKFKSKVHDKSILSQDSLNILTQEDLVLEKKQLEMLVDW